jgi:hypothetical protein
MAMANVGAPAARRERAPEPVDERAAQRPIQLDDRPDPLAPARGIAVAVGLGVLAWALVIAALLRL